MSPAVAEHQPRPASAPVIEFQTIPLDQLIESPMNVRRHYSPAAMAELQASIQ
jgi:hypothetical protein